MTRLSLSETLLNGVSHSGLMLGILAGEYRARCAQEDKAYAVSGLLLRIRLWLALGLDLGLRLICGGVRTTEGKAYIYRCEERSRHQARASKHRYKRCASGRKHPAHDLEILMPCVPDNARKGLTLNQYRERLARISVLSRLQIYRPLGAYRKSLRLGLLQGLGVISIFARSCERQCAAPLKPD